MGERVNALVRSIGREGVDIDLEHLQREQRYRSTWLEHVLTTPRPAINWDHVRQLLETSRRAGLI
jgi:hypothetical protein